MKTRSLLSQAILLCSLVLVFNTSINARFRACPNDLKPLGELGAFGLNLPIKTFTTETQRGFQPQLGERSTKIHEITLTTFRVRSCDLVDRGLCQNLAQKTRSQNFVLQRALRMHRERLVGNFSTASFSTSSLITSQEKNPRTTVPEAEVKAAQAIEAAADVNAKFVAAEEFVKKYPASKARPQVAQYLANQVFGVTEPNQRLAVAQKYLALFTDPTEAKAVKPALIDAYVQLKRFDEAFESGASYLGNDAEDVQIRVLLAIAGAELARGQNVKHIKASRDYGTKAIVLLEADMKPAAMDNDTWLKGKAMLPTLYQQMAVMSLVEQKTAEAQANLEKAAKLSPGDPFNYALLGSITNNEYQTLAQTARGLPDGASKNEMIQKATALLDKVIEQYARAVALATGKTQYQPLRDQVMQDLIAYYKYRHNNSEEGLQKYIDGYKIP